MAGIAVIAVKKYQKGHAKPQAIQQAPGYQQQPQQSYGQHAGYGAAGAAAGMAAGAFGGGSGPGFDQIRQVLYKCVQDVSGKQGSFSPNVADSSNAFKPLSLPRVLSTSTLSRSG